MQNKFNAPFTLFMGPQRSGTSWLHRYFQSREDVCLPSEVKEMFFFDFNFKSGPDFYFSHFHEKPQHDIVMEISATYFSHPDAPARVAEYFGRDIKLVCPLRNPITRSFSLYNHFKRYGFVEGSLQEACLKKPEILITSRYADHLKNWTDVFKKENIYICYQEDMEDNQSQYVEDICKFLDIEYKEIPVQISGYMNTSTKPPIQFIASLAQIVAQKLRRKRAYWIINLAKKIGIRELVFGKDTNGRYKDVFSDTDKEFLTQHLQIEIDKMEKFVGHPIHQWK